ncbi:MAG: hypothetical protein IKS67_00265, partial [Victivallales bacterium]|nr:hypothetical protein [Victivallales bacterium]
RTGKGVESLWLEIRDLLERVFFHVNKRVFTIQFGREGSLVYAAEAIHLHAACGGVSTVAGGTQCAPLAA